jgi:hypothetical protein
VRVVSRSAVIARQFLLSRDTYTAIKAPPPLTRCSLFLSSAGHPFVYDRSRCSCYEESNLLATRADSSRHGQGTPVDADHNDIPDVVLVHLH